MPHICFNQPALRVGALMLVLLVGASCSDSDKSPATALTADQTEAWRQQIPAFAHGVNASAVALVAGRKVVGHRDFVAAKKMLPRIYSGMEVDVYCGCAYSGKEMDLQSCGYVPRKSAARAARLEWEHVVPAEHLGAQRQCWQRGGRKACSGHDAVFDMMEGDLNNLLPSVGEVNGDRSNMSYGAWTRHPQPVYGQCQSVPDFRGHVFQPREQVRGRLARISFYMHGRYGLKISQQDRQLWCAWAKTHPVDAWETARDARIVAIQGEGNPLVEEPELISKICR
jgi:deoxyribonuclease I